MKKKILLTCSLITLLLTAFSFPVCAEEDPSDTPSSVPVPNSIRLDQYFFDNYELLPYIESNGSQYIDTGIIGKNNLKISFRVSDLNINNSIKYIFGSLGNSKRLFLRYLYESSIDRMQFAYGTDTNVYPINYAPYSIYDFVFDNNEFYINNSLINSFTESEYSTNTSLYIFAVHDGNNANLYSDLKLYNFNIYDYDTESYVRYYYPAKTKAGGVIGLYDAVSDTFVTTSGSVPFESPSNDKVMNFQIGTFVTSGLGWIGDILSFAVSTPIILFFMAIGLAGALYRWARRVVHF